MRNQTIRNNYGSINNVNTNRIRRLDKKKMIRRKVAIALAAGAIVGALSGFYIGRNTVKPDIPVLSEDSIMINVPLDIDPGDSILGIVDQYYNDEYESIYPSKDSYGKAIMELNQLKNSNINYDDTINIPIIIDKNNEYYIKMQSLIHEINEIQNNEYWINHIVCSGETISYLAAQASSSSEETYENTQQILKKNGLYGSDISDGDIIQIINPKLGSLKIELEEVQAELIASAQNNISKTK